VLVRSHRMGLATVGCVLRRQVVHWFECQARKPAMSEKPVGSIKTLARYEPDTVYIGTGEYVAECVRADDGDYYLAADADAAIEALQAEIEALRAEVERLTFEMGCLQQQY